MLQALIGPVTSLLDKFVEDKDQKAALAHEIATMAEKQAHESAIRLCFQGWLETVHWVDLWGGLCIPLHYSARPAFWSSGYRR